MNNIVIMVHGGLVTEVYCTDADADVYIIDEDCGESVEENLPIPLPETQLY